MSRAHREPARRREAERSRAPCGHAGFVKTEMTAHIKKPTPMALESDEAAELILTRLRSVPAEINFPASMTAAVRGIAGLPAPIRDATLLRFPTPDEDLDDEAESA